MLSVKGISKRYESPQQNSGHVLALNEISFEVSEGSFVSIVGPSGCGKTTLLKIIDGLLSPTSGEVCLNGHQVKIPPREMIFVFQDYNKALLPWRTVADNVRLGLEVRGLLKEEQDAQISKYLAMVGLEAARDRYPWELSGGMQQRVQVARALAYQPEILLLDEPFGSLDGITRAQLQDDLLGLWESLRMTIVHVTHDIDESLYLADRVLVLSRAPGAVKADLKIDLPRPRDQIETRSSRVFIDLRTTLYGLLMPEAGRKAVYEEKTAIG